MMKIRSEKTSYLIQFLSILSILIVIVSCSSDGGSDTPDHSINDDGGSNNDNGDKDETNDANQPPSADAGPTQTVNEGVEITLNGSGSDTDGTIAGYHWEQTAGPAMNLSNPDSALSTFTARGLDDDCVLSFKLTVTDNDGDTANDTVDITIKAKAVLFSGYDGVNGEEIWSTKGSKASTKLMTEISDYGHSWADGFTNVGDAVYFIAKDESFRCQLWKHDSNGISRVKTATIDPDDLTPFNGTLYFIVSYDQDAGLWKTDGTEDGTVLVKALAASRLTVFDDSLYFQNNDGLWKSDGTNEGTMLFYPGACSSPQSTNSRLYFSVYDNETGNELWYTDGTTSGTHILKDINPGSGSSISSLKIFPEGSNIYFIANDGVHGNELWVSDGTETGTRMVKDLVPGGADGMDHYFFSLSAVGDQVFFVTAESLERKRELWLTDGTEIGTRRVLPGIQPGENINPVGPVTRLNNSVFFWAKSSDTGPYDLNNVELWRSDGTSAGTAKVKSIHPKAAGDRESLSLTWANGYLFFQVTDGIHGAELWRSDGTETGTEMVKDILAGSGDSWPHNITAIDEKLYFTAFDGVHGNEVWQSDGTDANTVMIGDVNPSKNASTPASHFVDMGPYTLFAAIPSGTRNQGLWRNDGESDSTHLVKDIASDYDDYVNRITRVGATAFFKGNNNLWKTDGTDTGTIMVQNSKINDSFYDFYDFNAVEDQLFFISNNWDTFKYALWKSDGTEAGTGPFYEFQGTYEIGVGDFYTVGDSVVFPVDTNEGNEIELWKTDGTASGTGILKDINPTGPGISPHCASSFAYLNCRMAMLNDKLYFMAQTDDISRGLWETDGTEAGTVKVMEVDTGSSYLITSSNSNVTNAGSKLYFFNDDGVHGNELWTSDGTKDGARIVKNIVPDTDGPAGIQPVQLIPMNDELLFFAYTPFGDTPCNGDTCPTYGPDLWKTDGTEIGTIPLMAGPADGSFPREHLCSDDRLYFIYSTKETGKEIWRSDGTPEGTFMLKDINPGPGDGANLEKGFLPDVP